MKRFECYLTQHSTGTATLRTRHLNGEYRGILAFPWNHGDLALLVSAESMGQSDELVCLSVGHLSNHSAYETGILHASPMHEVLSFSHWSTDWLIDGHFGQAKIVFSGHCVLTSGLLWMWRCGSFRFIWGQFALHMLFWLRCVTWNWMEWHGIE